MLRNQPDCASKKWAVEAMDTIIQQEEEDNKQQCVSTVLDFMEFHFKPLGFFTVKTSQMGL